MGDGGVLEWWHDSVYTFAKRCTYWLAAGGQFAVPAISVHVDFRVLEAANAFLRSTVYILYIAAFLSFQTLQKLYEAAFLNFQQLQML